MLRKFDTLWMEFQQFTIEILIFHTRVSEEVSSNRNYFLFQTLAIKLRSHKMNFNCNFFVIELYFLITQFFMWIKWKISSVLLSNEIAAVLPSVSVDNLSLKFYYFFNLIWFAYETVSYFARIFKLLQLQRTKLKISNRWSNLTMHVITNMST